MAGVDILRVLTEFSIFKLLGRINVTTDPLENFPLYRTGFFFLK